MSLLKLRTRASILTARLNEEYHQRVEAAGGHFKFLPLADDPKPKPRAAHERDYGTVPRPPSLWEACKKRR